jgi:hypothetical protein
LSSTAATPVWHATRSLIVFGVVPIGGFMGVMHGLILNVAIPTTGKDLTDESRTVS